MNAPDGGDGLSWVSATLHGGYAVFKEVWGAFLTPLALGWWGWRRWSAARADEQAKERRTDQEKRDARDAARVERMDARDQELFKRNEAERDRAVSRGDKAEAELDAARDAHEAAVRRLHDERWRLELLLVEYEHAIRNLRQIVNELEPKAGIAPRAWPPLERPKPPADAD